MICHSRREEMDRLAEYRSHFIPADGSAAY